MNLRDGWARIRKLVFGTKADAQGKLMRSQSVVSVATPVTKPGETQGFMDGTFAGGVVWPVDPESHDGASFLNADAFFAWHDAKAEKVYMLDDASGERHPGAKPLRVGHTVTILGSKTRSGFGTVTRTAEHGTAGHTKNVFQHSRADLIAHHLKPNPPDNSSLVGDPDEAGRQGGLHYPLRVREWVREFCVNYFSPRKLFAPLFNMGRNGDGTPAYGAAHWDRDEGVLSDEAGGPLATADDGNHVLAFTNEPDANRINQGGNAINVLYGPIDGLYMPEEIILTQWEPGSKGPFVMRVEKRPDFDAKHKNHCGKEVPGLIKWQTWDMFREYPPTIKEPPPKAPKRPPPREPEEPGKPPAMLVPPENGIPPTAATPNEIESPSRYGHPMPSVPDGEPTRGPGDAPGDALPDHPQDLFWQNRYGTTEKDWNNFSNICTHEYSLPVYESATRGTGPNPWPVKNAHRTGALQLDAQGNIIGRDANVGNGSVIDAPAWSKPWHALSGMHSANWRASEHARIILAGKNGAGTTIDGRLGLGARGLTSPFIISGQEFRLGFDGAGGITEPDLHLYPKSSTGTEGLDTGAAKLVIHEDVHITGDLTVDGSGGGGGIGGSTGGTDEAVLVADGTGGSTLKATPVIVDSATGNMSGVGTLGSGAISSTGHIKSSSASAGIGYATGAGGTVTQATSKSTAVTINGVCGQITTHDDTLATGASVSFVVNNSACDSKDVVILMLGGVATDGTYQVQAENPAGGTFVITLRNVSGGDLAEFVPINFAIIKGVFT